MKAAERKPSARSVLRPTWAAVLIGGRSSRMGFSKTLLRTGGGFVLERIVAAAGEVAREVVLVGEAPLPAGELSALQRLQDAPGVEGPLGGLLAALRSRPRTSWIVISCDAPFLSAGALRWLLAQAKPGDIAGWSLISMRRRGPSRSSRCCTPRARSLMEATARAGERSIRRILAGMKIRSPRVPEELRRAFANVNTPEEWRRAQRKSEV